MIQRPESRDLPAAYRSPWTTLGENLQAVLADTGLRTRELWRRNGQGSLWRPAWWPVDLAPLFWPLLVGAALALLAAALGSIIVLGRGAAPPQPQIPAEHSVVPLELPSTPEQPPPRAELEPVPLAVSPAAPPVEPPPDGSVTLDAPEEELDPLAALLTRSGADGLLLGAQARSDQLTLVLQVSPAYGQGSRAEQQQRADRWQQWAFELGYDHLELRDSRAGLIARDALVGSGMIVLTPSPRP
ncbi:MAG: hypothetical protein FJ056_00525 [Cyanobacteria bacterium M_surface_10_m2_179]|nr:hypothetical protein [Cyanobacteria bacterium M_surface_10_m2_179]